MAVTLETIEDAARRLAGHAVVTPLLESPLLNGRLGGRLLLKAESLQRTGSFKFRGAFARLSALAPAERQAGVVAYSSGNHAQAVAAAARMLGLAATIVMPADAPAAKLAATRAWGATIVAYDRYREDREAIGGAIARERGAVLVPPFDDEGIISDQGTLGLELAAQAAAMGATLDAVLVPCSGGGMTAGVATALAARMPKAAVHAVEPVGFDDTARSLAAGRRLANAPLSADHNSICDALLVPSPDAITFEINKRLVKSGLAVSDSEVLDAMAVAFAEFKLVLEPGGAVALAAVLAGKLDCRGRTIAAVGSGGNVDGAVFTRALEQNRPR